MTNKESRCVVLGHLQRGGSPNAFDRMLGTNFGACAVRALANGQIGKMVALQAALTGLAAEKPAILIDTLVVQGYGAPNKNGVQRLSVQLNLSVLRRRP